MKKIVGNILLSIIAVQALTSCSTTLNSSSNSKTIPLTAENLHQLNGRYEVRGVNSDSLSKHIGGMLNLGRRFCHPVCGRPGGVVELKVINQRKVKVITQNDYSVKPVQTIRGNLKDGYFEVKRLRFPFFVIANGIVKSRSRIKLSEEGTISIDNRARSVGFAIVIPILFADNSAYDIKFRRQEPPAR